MKERFLQKEIEELEITIKDKYKSMGIRLECERIKNYLMRAQAKHEEVLKEIQQELCKEFISCNGNEFPSMDRIPQKEIFEIIQKQLEGE